jgi:hypothetical protein
LGVEAGKTGDGASYSPGKVAAAKRLLLVGWWSLEDNEKKLLEPLIAAGLSVGINPNLSMLGLRPALVLANTKGKASLYDIAGDASFAFRSYYSSSSRAVMLAAPPADASSYTDFWQSKEAEGSLSDVLIHPLHEIRFLASPIDAFNEDTLSFDFSWDNLPRRGAVEPVTESAPKPYGLETLAVLNYLQRNPVADSLGDLAKSTGVDPERCKEALGFVTDFPLGWGFKGADGLRQAGLVCFFEGLKENVFGPVRASIRDIPFTVLEAWGRDYDRYVYFAEMMVPAENLAETSEFLGRVTAVCSSSFSYGFYEPTHLHQFNFSKKLVPGS